MDSTHGSCTTELDRPMMLPLLLLFGTAFLIAIAAPAVLYGLAPALP